MVRTTQIATMSIACGVIQKKVPVNPAADSVVEVTNDIMDVAMSLLVVSPGLHHTHVILAGTSLRGQQMFVFEVVVYLVHIVEVISILPMQAYAPQLLACFFVAL